MGAYSTMEITRADAFAEIIRALSSASDYELEQVLFDLVGEKLLYNFSIVSDYESTDWFFKYKGAL